VINQPHPIPPLLETAPLAEWDVVLATSLSPKNTLRSCRLVGHFTPLPAMCVCGTIEFTELNMHFVKRLQEMCFLHVN